MSHGIIPCANGIMGQAEFRMGGLMRSMGGYCLKSASVVMKGVVLP
jgi:hypothetical protein